MSIRSASARHDPVRLVAPGVGEDGPEFRWGTLPALMAVERVEHTAQDGARMSVPISATPLVYSDAVVTCGYDGRVRRHTRQLGSHNVVHRMNEPIYSTPALLIDGRALVLGSRGTLACLDPDGDLLWQVHTPTPTAASPTPVDDESVAVCGLGGLLTFISLRDGVRLWSSRLPRPWSHGIGSLDAERDPYATPVAVGGRLVVVAGERALCVDIDGKPRWAVDLGSQVKASPTVAPDLGLVVMALVDGRVLAVDLVTGKVTRSVALPGPVYASPAISGDVVCVSTTREVVGLSADKLTTLWSRDIAVRDHGSITVAPDGDVVYVGHGGVIVALAARDGAFRYELRPRTAQERLRFDGTPVVSPDGWLYGASYDGFVASFMFRGA